MRTEHAAGAPNLVKCGVEDVVKSAGYRVIGITGRITTIAGDGNQETLITQARTWGLHQNWWPQTFIYAFGRVRIICQIWREFVKFDLGAEGPVILPAPVPVLTVERKQNTAYLGVYKYGQRESWYAILWRTKKLGALYLGTFATPEEAACARDAAALQYQAEGGYAQRALDLNFPDAGRQKVTS
jgi:hypothetical protein